MRTSVVGLETRNRFRRVWSIELTLANATLDNKPATFSVIYKGVDGFCFVHFGWFFLG